MDRTGRYDNDHEASPRLEATARVVAVADAIAWLEPEQTSGCGGCASRSACPAALFGGAGATGSRLAARRFSLPRAHGASPLRVGERVVVGACATSLAKASLVAYAVPLAGVLTAGGAMQLAAGSDALTLAAMLVGLALGLGVARMISARPAFSAAIAPRLIRPAAGGEPSHPG